MRKITPKKFENIFEAYHEHCSNHDKHYCKKDGTKCDYNKFPDCFDTFTKDKLNEKTN